MWGDKPPRRKRGSQRRFGGSAFVLGVLADFDRHVEESLVVQHVKIRQKGERLVQTEPSPLFEWSVFGFFWGVPKETRHRSAETLPMPVIYATTRK